MASGSNNYTGGSNHKIISSLPKVISSFPDFNTGSSRDPRRPNPPPSSQPPSATVRPEEVQALLTRIRSLEDQARTQRQVVATTKACVEWLESKTESTLRMADEVKVQVLRFTAPETQVRHIFECSLDRFIKRLLWNLKQCQVVLYSLSLPEQMSEKTFRSNVAPS